MNANIPTGDLSTPAKKFVMELDEPGSDLPEMTRKFILYFTSPVVARVDTGSQTITFEPASGGKYNGLLQLGYAGSSQRGDGSKVMSDINPFLI